MAGPHVPLSTLRPRPHDRRRMTRGPRGSLLLRCETLAFSPLHRCDRRTMDGINGVRTCHSPISRRSRGAQRRGPTAPAGLLTSDLCSRIHALHHLAVRPGARLDLEPHAPVAVLVLRARDSTSVAGAASSSGARGSWSNHRDELPDAGGPRAGHGSEASPGKPTCSSIFLATRFSVISAMGFIRPQF